MLSLRMWLVGMFIAPLIPALAMLCSDYVGEKARAWRTRLELPESGTARIAVVRSPERGD